jgi:hypothetical protein
MKPVSILTFALLIMASPIFAQEEDLIGSKKASSILPKAVKEVLKKEGYRFTETIQVTGFQDQKVDFRGQTRKKKSFAAAQGSAEVYAKGVSYLVRSGETFLPPDKMQGAEGTSAAMFRNPIFYLLEVRKLARGAQWGEDADVGGQACIVAELSADERTLKSQVKEFGGNVGELKRYGVSDISPYIDLKRSTSDYFVSVGKSDLLLYRVEWKLKLMVKKNAIPPGVPVEIPSKIEVSMELVLSGYGDELELDIPKFIQRWSGVKN